VDGGVADNVGMRSVLDVLELMEALQSVGYTTPLDHIRNIIVFVVNSLSIPKVSWDKSESAPGTLQIMVKAAGVPIDHYSYESTELLRDMQAKWRAMRLVRKSSAFAAEKDKTVTAALHTPEATIYAIDVSFSQLKDNDERAYLNELPTSFHLEPEQVDRLRAAAGKIILQSPDFRRLIEDQGGRIESTRPTPPINHDATP
jgi:NTE family protein